MKLLTAELKRQIPPLYSTENQSNDDHLVVCKYFTPDSSWAWYVMEASAVLADGSYAPLADTKPDEVFDVLFFGVVDGLELEWGHFSLSELESVRGPFGLKIERDLYFEPTRWGDLKKRVLR